MDKIRTNLACVFGTLSKDIAENPKLVAAYVVMLLLTGVVMGLFWFIPNAMSSTNQSGSQSTNYLAGLVEQSLTAMLFVCIACLLRRYWPFYGVILATYTAYALYLMAMAPPNNPDERLSLFMIIVVTSVEILLVPALTFFGLCCLAGLPRPHSKGWGACLREHSG
ncbi:MAG: hypothetical protein ACYC1M_13680 [Armatimonadota bacterium]